MYELWLGLNILWELSLTQLPVLITLLVVWIVMMVYVLLRRPLHRARAIWRRTFLMSSMLAAAFGVMAFFLIPYLTQSSFDAMGYWVDWATLAGMSASMVAMAFCFIWPLLTLRWQQG